jgi:hypothetical protein
VEQSFDGIGEISLADAGENPVDLHVSSDGFEIDTDRNVAAYGDECPRACVREVEFESFDGGFAVRSESKGKVARRLLQIAGENRA